MSEQGLNLPGSIDELTDLENEVMEGERSIPTPQQTAACTTNVDYLLWSVYENCYKEEIEPADTYAFGHDPSDPDIPTVPLSAIIAVRRSKVEKWRNFFITNRLHLLRQTPNARNLLIMLIIEVLRDIVE